MRVDTKVIDLGWGEIKSAIAKLDDKAFLKSPPAQRKLLLDHYQAAFRAAESGNHSGSQEALQALAESLPGAISPDAGRPVTQLIDAQRAKIG